MRHRVAAMAIAVLAVLAVGCGGGTGGDTSAGGDHKFPVNADTTVTPVQALSKAKFVAHVNDLCRRKWPFVLNAVRQTRNFTRKLYPQTSPLQRYIRGVHVSYFAAIDYHIFDEIHRLGAPPGETQAVEDVIGSMQEGVERGQQTRVTSPAQVKALFVDYNRIARRYGLDQCLVEGAHLPYAKNLSTPVKGLALPADKARDVRD